MLKRKIDRQLAEWKNTSGHKPLIVKGCRQCGKTFSVLDFAKKNYKHVVYLNFFENPDYASVFAGSLEIDNIVMLLSALLGKDAVFKAGETVLVLFSIGIVLSLLKRYNFYFIIQFIFLIYYQFLQLNFFYLHHLCSLY